MVKGWTRIFAEGGWKGDREAVWLYKVAGLDNLQRHTIVDYLLHNTGMKDLYVVLPGGMAVGYCLEEIPMTQAERFQANRGWPYQPGCVLDRFVGTQNLGWPEK